MSARQEVLFVSPSLAGGGAERVCTTLLRHLDRERFAPVLALADKSGPLLAELPEDVPVLDLQAGRVRKAWGPLIKVVRQRRPQTVFTMQGHLNCVVRLAMPFFPRGTRVVAREAIILSRSIAAGEAHPMFSRLYRLLYPGFDAVVCQSAEMEADLVERHGLPASRAVRIPNPVDTARLQALAARGGQELPLRRPFFVAMGRLERQKGFDLLLQALAQLPQPRPLLVLLGQGGQEAALRAQALESGLGADVEFAGFVRNPYPLLAAADLFVLSSRYEGFPNALLEALSLGTPTVAFACPGGVREIVQEGVNGRLAPPEDVPALAALLADWRSLPRERSRVAQSVNARYGLRAVLRRYEAVFAGEVPPETKSEPPDRV